MSEEDTWSLYYSNAYLHIPKGLDALKSEWKRAEEIDSASLVSNNEVLELGKCIGRDGYGILRGAVSKSKIDAARAYIKENWDIWDNEPRCRCDDWRTHFLQGYGNILIDGHAAVAEILSPRMVATAERLTKRKVCGVLYTQIAFRTPLKKKPRFGTAYHIDGEANAQGARFPDHFSLLVGIALSPQNEQGNGNFTVFPGTHLRDWSTYPDLKRNRSLPHLTNGRQLCLDVGDAFFVHPLLPHRGGCNTSSTTRELIFFRLQFLGIQYDHPSRPRRILKENPFYELPTIFSILRGDPLSCCLSRNEHKEDDTAAK
mmetsp:Transcript_16372/g.19927  ORF Transcript_16372/g.19927 Transcript_16372/m.19927 type:complete len:315 (+) Transcript_16372:44-988(+)